MLEAAALSGAAGYALKELTRRERPYTTADEDAWGEDGDSFPSLHTTAAFAIGTVLAESGDDRHRWCAARSATASRSARPTHAWTTTRIGCRTRSRAPGLGIATARFVMKQRDARSRARGYGFEPFADGIAIGYTVDLRR